MTRLVTGLFVAIVLVSAVPRSSAKLPSGWERAGSGRFFFKKSTDKATGTAKSEIATLDMRNGGSLRWRCVNDEPVALYIFKHRVSGQRNGSNHFEVALQYQFSAEASYGPVTWDLEGRNAIAFRGMFLRTFTQQAMASSTVVLTVTDGARTVSDEFSLAGFEEAQNRLPCAGFTAPPSDESLKSKRFLSPPPTFTS
jgi:hypothetical protein